MCAPALLVLRQAALPAAALSRSTGSWVQIEATVHGSVPGLELTLVSNGEDLVRQRFEGTAARFDWTDTRPTGGTRYYYLRARQADGHLGWSSPVWVSGERTGSNRETSLGRLSGIQRAFGAPGRSSSPSGGGLMSGLAQFLLLLIPAMVLFWLRPSTID